ncbi:pH-sensitive chloride channel 2-like [Onthophagus taurus]|uniref:pH-sensitive chloride channel 2-like n=1 Tax=Onthophagus taurus TaxID=166361 RepID=UPI0039BDCA31
MWSRVLKIWFVLIFVVYFFRKSCSMPTTETWDKTTTINNLNLTQEIASTYFAKNKTEIDQTTIKDGLNFVEDDNKVIETESVCPELSGNYDELTQTRFSTILTQDCRYDKLTKPDKDQVTDVTLQIDIRHIEAMEQMQFKMHILVQYRYTDTRLNYESISPKRGHMLGEDTLRKKIWIPHLVLSNEKDTFIMGLEGKDVFVSISPTGEVIYSYRMTAMIYCWMDLLYFPFDEQTCSLHFMSWTYNSSQLVLKWDDEDPAKVASQLHLTEFRLLEHHTFSGETPAPLSKGAFAGNYSTLILEFKVAREIGYYLMDYFIPSIMLVCTSWVTFWLQADNAAPRVTLGASTMLSFITLASGQTKNLPKVSYIKVSEIWFLVCALFIFASMVEFAFVNIIWRRKKEVALIKVNSKYILKSTLTPKLARKEFEKTALGRENALYKSRSVGSLNGSNGSCNDNKEFKYNNYLTVHSPMDIPKIITQSADNIIQIESGTNLDQDEKENKPRKWTTMSPQEVAIWIDKRSRIFFPALFTLFNIVFWTVVLIV